MRGRELGYLIVFVLTLFLITLFYVFPSIWVFIMSLKPAHELFILSLPSEIIWTRYPMVLFDWKFYPTLRNSIIVCLSSMAAALVIATPASYALVRLKHLKFRQNIFLLFLLAFVFPGISFLGYIYLLIHNIGLYNNIAGLVITYTAGQLPMMIWLLSGYIRSIPIEVEEAALIDGCTTFQLFTRIILPLMLPGLGVAAIFAFINLWGEFIVAFSITMTNAARTVPIGTLMFTGIYELNWGEIATASVIAAIPPVILALVAQKFIISGITAGMGK
jgi:ABC-type glycerol-3-phosphate transport system permease component